MIKLIIQLLASSAASRIMMRYQCYASSTGPVVALRSHIDILLIMLLISLIFILHLLLCHVGLTIHINFLRILKTVCPHSMCMDALMRNLARTTTSTDGLPGEEVLLVVL